MGEARTAGDLVSLPGGSFGILIVAVIMTVIMTVVLTVIVAEVLTAIVTVIMAEVLADVGVGNTVITQLVSFHSSSAQV
jgi:hypothetical protein